MSPLGYLLFFVLTVPLAAVSFCLWMINPVVLFLPMAAPFVRVLGRQPHATGWSAFGPTIGMVILFPLTLAPLHWVNYELLGWDAWGYAGVLLAGGFVLAFLILLKTSDRLR